jgi:hypothetical protein
LGLVIVVSWINIAVAVAEKAVDSRKGREALRNVLFG